MAFSHRKHSTYHCDSRDCAPFRSVVFCVLCRKNVCTFFTFHTWSANQWIRVVHSSYVSTHSAFIFCITVIIITQRNHIMELTRCEMFVFFFFVIQALVAYAIAHSRPHDTTLQYNLPFRDNITCH